MSEHLQNNDYKQGKLKEIIKKLHDGEGVKEVKKDFNKLIKNVSPEEFAGMENALIQEGFPPEEIQKLCDVHVEVFRSDLGKQKKQSKIPGHPVNSYKLENKEAVKIAKQVYSLSKKIVKAKPDSSVIIEFQTSFSKLREIEKHYQRKENQLFPYLEQKGFTGPSKVMWGKHDEIRAVIKEIDNKYSSNDFKEVKSLCSKLLGAIKKMIFMEEKILLPTSLKKLNEMDWIAIRQGEKEIGYSWITPGNVWDANLASVMMNKKPETVEPENINKTITDALHIDEGNLTPDQINMMLKTLPIDITYVDENDTVLYYSSTEDRIFPRSPGIIGRKVQNCHPPKSVHIVEKILTSFKNKEKKSADFWINMNGMAIYIRYFPMFDKSGNYKGCLEVSQEISEIKKLEGERRLLDW